MARRGRKKGTGRAGNAVDWEAVTAAVERLRRRDRGMPGAGPEDVLRRAHRLAGYYRRAGRPLPDILAALVRR